MTKAIVSINNLNKVIDKKTVIKQLNATIETGDVIALLGANGAGKTTLLETILGFSLPTSGDAVLFGNKEACGLNDDAKQLIGYVPQNETLIEFVSVQTYLDSIASFYKHWNHALINTLITNWNIPKDSAINKLSVGQKQMVSILAAIGHEPNLLILDEPVSSLDPSSRRQFLQALIEMQLNNNTSILFSTHIVTDVERVANRLWIMKSGELIVDDSIDRLKEESDQSLEDLFLEVNQ